MTLKAKIPPPIVTLLFLLLIYFTRGLTAPLGFEFQTHAALVFFTVGFGIIIAGFLEFRKLGTTVNPLAPETATKLATRGIFKFSRNPMYLGLVFFLIAGAVYFAAFSGLLLIPLFIIYMSFFQILPEEKAMEKLFKKDFRDYCAKVRRWI